MNYKNGFFISSVIALLFFGLTLFLVVNNRQHDRSDDHFRKELIQWVESGDVDSVLLNTLKSNNKIALYPGLLSDYTIIRNNDHAIQATLPLVEVNENTSKRKGSNFEGNKPQEDGNDTDDSDYIGQQLNELVESNLELRKKLESYGYLQFKTETGVVVDYVGELKNDQPHGYGTAIFSSGKRYEGNWINGMKFGEGTYYYKNNERYEGTFVNNVREGDGIYYFSNGDRYIGEWKGDKRDGQGYILKKNGSITKKGIWKDDKPVK